MDTKELEGKIGSPGPIQLEGLKLLRGWKEIGGAIGLRCSNQSVRRLARKFGLPIWYLGNKPVATEGMLRLWLAATQKAVLGPEREKGPIAFDTF